MSLRDGQDELIARLSEVNPRTAVILVGGSAVELPWINEVPAVLQVWYPGQEGGHAIADAILGSTEPMGRLPFSWPAKLSDVRAHADGNYGPDRVEYAEGLYLGYRAHDAGGPKPLFPFGFGLGYTTWEYGDISIEDSDPAEIKVALSVTNSGDRAGAEVIQLYLSL